MTDIHVDEKIINIIKLETEEYEFKMIDEYVEYYGYSYLKNLKFPRFDKYLKYYEGIGEIKLSENDYGYTLEFPIPYHDEFEVVILKKKELSEVDELKITIKKNNEIIEKYEHEINLAWENVKIATDLYKNEKKENEKLIKTLEYVSNIKNEEIEQLKKDKNKSILDTICDYIDELL
jgi:hypothetical protein